MATSDMTLESLMAWRITIHVPEYTYHHHETCDAEEKIQITHQEKEYHVSKYSCHQGQIFNFKIEFTHDYPNVKPLIMLDAGDGEQSEDFCCLINYQQMDKFEWEHYGEKFSDGDNGDDNSDEPK